MALANRFAYRSSNLLRQCKAPALPARTFTTRAAPSCVTRSPPQAWKNSKYARLFSSSTVRKDQTENAPSAKAYLESGVVKGAANPVNVKKVLVIGSGGLSIGQAGEFDYSGLCPYTSDFRKMSHWLAKSLPRSLTNVIQFYEQ